VIGSAADFKQKIPKWWMSLRTFSIALHKLERSAIPRCLPLVAP